MKALLQDKTFDFSLPKLLECAEPTESRGLARDAVKLMVSRRFDDQIRHTQFSKIGDYLEEGDVLIVNTSGTLNAALPIQLPNGSEGRVHLSTKMDNKVWLVEIRHIQGQKTKRYHQIKSGQTFTLPGNGKMEVLTPYYGSNNENSHLQLWKVRFYFSLAMNDYLEKYGQPIRYAGLENYYPSEYYQTVFASRPGSAEMPSAGRAFTSELVTQLVLKGVQFAPILLHTGVSSLEIGEKPYPEYFEVPGFTASIVNRASREGRRVIAVGTTAIRAIESAADDFGTVISKKGMTDLFITPKRGLKVVSGMLTGFHEPKASHLLMMEALANRSHLLKAYSAAIEKEYQWHEFGDLHLIL